MRKTPLLIMLVALGCKPKLEELGGPCKDHRACESRVCLAAVMHHKVTPWQGGYCTDECGDCADGVCRDVNGDDLCLLPCEGDEACREGYVCDDGACQPDCTFGRVCAEGVCKPEGYCSRPQGEGAECEVNVDCLGGLCLSADNGWGGGYCTGDCANGCGEGASCQTLAGKDLCLLDCDAEHPCREGYVCGEDWGACLPDCRAGWDCGALECDQASGECRAPVTETLVTGEACVRDEGCPGGMCIEAWPLGYCSRLCELHSDCPDDAACMGIAQQQICLKRCDEANPCRRGYLCSPAGACVPDCREGWACPEGTACDAMTGGCVVSEFVPAGTPCATNEACGGPGSLCIPEIFPNGSPSYWPDGYCSNPCTLDVDCGEGGICRPQPEGPRCLESCGIEGCRAGYVCDPQVGGGGVGGACIPDCNGGLPCMEGLSCTRNGYCRAMGG